jgi:hypothetical protein
MATYTVKIIRLVPEGKTIYTNSSLTNKIQEMTNSGDIVSREVIINGIFNYTITTYRDEATLQGYMAWRESSGIRELQETYEAANNIQLFAKSGS